MEKKNLLNQIVKTTKESLLNQITKMENIESDSDYEIWKDKKNKLYEVDYDGLDVLGIFEIDQDRNIISELFRAE